MPKTEAARIRLLDRLRQTISKRLGDFDFGVDEAAAACRVSVRHLQSVLNDAGTTFTDALGEARLELAFELLQSSMVDQIKIKQVAARCGFKSQSYFATAYKKRFGVRPSDT